MPSLPVSGQVAPEWAKAVLSSVADTDGFATSISIDGDFLYSTVKYRSVQPIVLSETVTLTASATYNYCVLKLNMTTRTVASVLYLPSPLTYVNNNHLAVLNGNIYICGRYTSVGTVTLGNGVILGGTSGLTNAFLIKYTNNTAQWAASVSGEASGGSGVFATTDDVYMYGSNSMTDNATPTTQEFIIKYSSTGTLLWRKNITAIIRRIFVSDNVYIVGLYQPSIEVEFGNNATGTRIYLEKPTTNTVITNGYIAAVSTATATPLWARRIPSSTACNIFGITGTTGALYICGSFVSSGTRILDGITIPASSYDGVIYHADMIIAKFNPSTGTAVWIKTMSGIYFDEAYSIALSDTNIYIVGRYNSNATIDLSTGTIPASLGDDGILLKYNTDGTFLLHKRISGTGTGLLDSAYTVAVSGSRVFVGGLYNTTSVVNIASGVDLPIGYNSFLIEYNASGDYAYHLTVSSTKDASGDLRTVYADGDSVYVAGFYQSVMPIALGNDVSLPVTAGSNDAYIIKYTSAGVPLWARTIRGLSGDNISDIYVSETDIYVYGFYNSASAVSIGISLELPISTSTSAFLIKYDSAGTAMWRQIFSPPGAVVTSRVRIYNGDIYICGSYISSSSTVDVGTKADNTKLLLPASSVTNDGFLIKYTSAGVAVWAAQIRGTGVDMGYTVAINDTGVFFGGNYISSLIVPIGTRVSDNTPLSLPTASVSTAFIIKYAATDGSPLWYKTIPATSSVSWGLVANADGVYACGSVTTMTDISLSPVAQIGVTQGSTDAFIVRYNNDGNATIAKQFGSTSAEVAHAVTLHDDALYVCGSYSNLTSGAVSLPATTSMDAFLLKCDLSCNVIWTKQLKGTNSDAYTTISATSSGVYVSGRYNSILSISIGNGISLPAYPSTAIPSQSGVICKYSHMPCASVSSAGIGLKVATISWTPSTLVTSPTYKLYYYPTNAPSSITEIPVGTATTYDITGLTANVAYTYYVATMVDSAEMLTAAQTFTTKTLGTFETASELNDISLSSLTVEQVKALASNTAVIAGLSQEVILSLPTNAIPQLSASELGNLMNQTPVDISSTLFMRLIANSNTSALTSHLSSRENKSSLVNQYIPALTSYLPAAGSTKAVADKLIAALGALEPTGVAPSVELSDVSILGTQVGTRSIANTPTYIIPGGTSGLTVPLANSPQAIKLTGSSSFTLGGAAVNVVFSGNTVSVNGVAFDLNDPTTTAVVIGGRAYECALTGSITFTTSGTETVCFLRDAPVLTPTGYRPISTFEDGDLVKTADGRVVAVKRVFTGLYAPGDSTNPYVIPKGFCGALCPVAVSPKHEIMVPGHGMVKAQELGLPRIRMTEPFRYYNLELENWAKDNLVVAGVECESMMPPEPIRMTKEECMAMLRSRYGSIERCSRRIIESSRSK